MKRGVCLGLGRVSGMAMRRLWYGGSRALGNSQLGPRDALLSAVLMSCGRIDSSISCSLGQGLCGGLVHTRRMFCDQPSQTSTPDLQVFFDSLKTQTLQTVLKDVSVGGDSKLAILNHAREKGMKVADYNYTIVISQYLRENNIDKAMELLKEIEPVTNKKPDLYILSKILKWAFKNKPNYRFPRGKRNGYIMNAAQMIKDSGEQIPLALATSLIEHLLGENNREAAFSYKADLEKRNLLDSYVYTTFLAYWARKNNTKEVANLLTEIHNRGMKKNLEQYTTLLHYYGKRSEFENIAALRKEMQEDGVEPDIVLLQILLITETKMKNFEEAELIRKKFEEKNVLPDAPTINQLLQIAYAQNDIEAIVKYHKELDRRGERPTIQVYNAILHYFAAHHPEQVETIYQDMKEVVRPDIKSQNQRLLALLNLHKIKEAYSLFNGLEAGGYKPNQETFNMLLMYWGGEKDFYRVQEVLNQMKERQLRSDTHTYSILIRMALQNNNHERAMEIKKEMEDIGLKPNFKIYDSLVDYYETKKDESMLQELYSQMRARNLNPDSVMFFRLRLLSLFNKDDPQRAFAYKEEMASKGLHADLRLYNEIIATLTKKKDSKSLAIIRADAKAKGIEPRLLGADDVKPMFQIK